jgi:hypothetical protein
MLRTFAIFMGLVFMLGCGVAIAAWPQDQSAQNAQFTEQQLRSGYVRIRAGVTPVSQLAGLGFDTNGAAKLSYLGVMEQFMPKDSFGFDALDPSVQACFEARDRCTAYIFTLPHQPGAKVVLLIDGGRVAYKSISGFSGMASARPMMLRAALD